MRFLPLLILAPALSGCVVGTIAKTAVDVATIPVKAVSAGVDAATTSQSEADQKRGREVRKEEERRGRALREWQANCARLKSAGQPCPDTPR
jgi:hypothetical protein